MPSTWGNRTQYGEFKIVGAAEGHPKLLGEGSFGKTFEAERLESVAGEVIREPVALKVLNPDLLRSASKRLQFVQERTALTRLKHANLVHSIKCGEDKGEDGKGDVEVYFAMELCMGGDLARLVKRFGALPERVAALIGLQAATGLREMHRRDMVHRDIKPHNIMLFEALPPSGTLDDIKSLLEENESLCRIVDFGLVGTIVNEKEASGPALPQKFVGSMMYASPEQILERKDIDGRTDIYALGMTLWFLVQGRGPLLDARGDELKHASEAEGRHLSSNEHEPDLPNNLSKEFKKILASMVAKRPEDRMPSARDLVIALERYIERSVRAAEPSLPSVQSQERLQSIFSFQAGSQKNFGKQRFEAINLATQTRVRLTVVEDLEDLDNIRSDFDEVVKKLRGQAQILRQSDVPATILPVHEVIYAADALAYSEDFPGGITLAEVLQARTASKRPFSFRESEVIFRPIAEALDYLINQGWEFISLPCEAVWLSDDALAANRQDKHLMCRPLDQWTGLRVTFSGMWVPPEKEKDSGDDMLYASTSGSASSLAAEESLRAPVSAFLRLVYRTLSGSDVPDAADRWPNGYIPSVALQTASNNLIRDLLCKQREWSAVTLILNELCADEGVSVNVPVVPFPNRWHGRGSSGALYDSKRTGVASTLVTNAGASGNSTRTSSASQWPSKGDFEPEGPSPIEARDAPNCEIISLGVVRLGEHLQDIPPIDWVSKEFIRCSVTGKWFFFPKQGRPLFSARVDRPKYADSPYTGVGQEVDWSQWKPGGTVLCAKTQYPFLLPQDLPLPKGILPSEGTGRILSYFDPSGPPITIAPADWTPGAEITCPKTQNIFALPEELPPLEAKIDNDKVGWIHSPYDPEAAWTVPPTDWVAGHEIVCNSTRKRLILPSAVEQWVAEAIVLDAGMREVRSPYVRGAKSVVPAMEWRSGGRIKCPPGGRIARLPDNLPPLVGRVVPGSPGVILSPFSSEKVNVPLPSWVSGREIVCPKSGLAFLLPPGLPIPDGTVLKDKPGLAFSPYDPTRTVKVSPLHWLPGDVLTCPATGERFKLPEHLPPLHALLTPGDPGLVRSPFAPEASDENEVEFEFRVPIEDWKAGNTFECPVTKHVFALPPHIEDWIIDGSWVPGAPGRVRSPFKNGGEVRLTKEQWKQGTLLRCPLVGRLFRVPITEDLPSLELEKAAVQQALKFPDADEKAAVIALEKDHPGVSPEVVLSIWKRHQLDTIEGRNLKEVGVLVDGKPGTVISPYTKKEINVPPETWVLPGASVLCESGKKFRLPSNLPRLLGSVDETRPGFAASPFDPAHFYQVRPWQWLPGAELTCEHSGHPFVLPSELPAWEPEAIPDPKKLGCVFNPYSAVRESILISGSDWRGGNSLSIGDRPYRLPEALPPLVADLEKVSKGKVESPYAPGTIIPVSPGAWVPGGSIICPVTSLEFRLPEVIPECDFEGIDPHKDGTIQSPYGRGDRFHVPAREWIGGADVQCPETGKNVSLPKDLPLLEGKIDPDKPCQVLSPFDSETWMPVDVADWVEGGELRCQKTRRTFRLPEEKLPLPIAKVAAGYPGTVLSPFRAGAEILVPPMQWIEGGEIEDRTVRRRFRLPKSDLPLLEGKTVAGRSLLIKSPFDPKQEIVVSRSDWVAGHQIVCPTTKRMFALPRHLEAAPPIPPINDVKDSIGSRWPQRLKWAALFVVCAGVLALIWNNQARNSLSNNSIATTPDPSPEIIEQNEPDPVKPPPEPPPPEPYRIITESEQPDPPHAKVMLGGRLLSSWGGKMPADSTFPVNLSVTAVGYLPIEVDVWADSTAREVRLQLPKLSRSTGPLTCAIPAGGIDYTHIGFKWFRPLPSEEEAAEALRPKDDPIIFPLPQDINATKATSDEFHLPTGVYHVRLNRQGSSPDLIFDSPIQIYPNAKITFDKIPATIAGVYTSEEFVLGALEIIRVMKVNKNLLSGEVTDTITGGPENTTTDGINFSKATYPLEPVHSELSQLSFHPKNGLSGKVVNPKAPHRQEEFNLSKGKMYIDPRDGKTPPFEVKVLKHEVPTASAQ